MPWTRRPSSRCATRAPRIPHLSIADWQADSLGRDRWFRPDQLHLLWAGGTALATHVVESLDAALAAAPAAPSGG